jgi:mobilome CxxCx(11)CxxC protein
MGQVEDYNKLQGECWDNAVHSFGYGHIFNKRAQRLSRWTNSLTVFGILGPATIGATALGYGIDDEILKQSMKIAIPVGIFQFIISVIAIVYKWSDELSYSFEASQSYGSLSYRFKKLGKFPPANYDELNKAFEPIESESAYRNQQNSTHNIREWELRRGMKYALREFQRECVGCKKTPISMSSTECPVCGNYSIKYKLLNR